MLLLNETSRTPAKFACVVGTKRINIFIQQVAGKPSTLKLNGDFMEMNHKGPFIKDIRITGVSRGSKTPKIRKHLGIFNEILFLMGQGDPYIPIFAGRPLWMASNGPAEKMACLKIWFSRCH